MANTTMTRYYSLVMGCLNGFTAFFLFLMSRLNAIASWPNLLVSVLGPAATIIFIMIAIAWFLDALRPGAMRRFIPGGVEPTRAISSALCPPVEAPRPLPPSSGERFRTGILRTVNLPVYAYRLIRSMSRHT